MGICRQMRADPRDVSGMDEVETGLRTQPFGQPEPASPLLEASREVTGGEDARAIDASTEDQGGEDRHDPLGQWVLLQLLQALGLGLDVLGAVGHRLRQQLQVLVEDAGGGEIHHLLDHLGIGGRQHLLDRHHIHLLGPLGIPPGRCGVDDPRRRCDLSAVGFHIPQIPHHQFDARIRRRNGRELAGIPQPEQQLGVGFPVEQIRDVLANATAGPRDQDTCGAGTQTAAPRRSMTDLPASKKN